MALNDYGKLIVLVAILAAATVLALGGVIDPETTRLILVAELGYVTGNGVLARSAAAPSPVLVASDNHLAATQAKDGHDGGA